MDIQDFFQAILTNQGSLSLSIERLASAIEAQTKALDRQTDSREQLLSSAFSGQEAPSTAAVEEPKAEAKKPARSTKKVEEKVADQVEQEVVEEAKLPEADPIGDEPAPAAEFTLEQVRQGLKDYRAIEGAEAMMDVLKKAGASNLAELSPAKYAQVMKAIG